MRPPSNGARALLACLMLATQIVTWPSSASAVPTASRTARPTSTPRLTPEQQALEHYRAGRFDLAIEVLESRVENGGLRGAPLLRARELLARSYAGAGRRGDAKGVFKIMLYQDPRYRPDPTSVTADDRAIFAVALSEYASEMQGAPQERVGQPPPATTGNPSSATSRTPAGAPSGNPSPMPVAMPPATTPAAPPATPPPAPERRISAGATPPPMRVSRPRGSHGWIWWTAGTALAGTAAALAVSAGNNRTSTPTDPGRGVSSPLPSYPPPPP